MCYICPIGVFLFGHKQLLHRWNWIHIATVQDFEVICFNCEIDYLWAWFFGGVFWRVFFICMQGAVVEGAIQHGIQAVTDIFTGRLSSSLFRAWLSSVMFSRAGILVTGFYLAGFRQLMQASKH